MVEEVDMRNGEACALTPEIDNSRPSVNITLWL